VPKSLIADSSALAALIDRREEHHSWALATLPHLPYPWFTCEAVISETFFLLGVQHHPLFDKLLRRGCLRITYNLNQEMEAVLDLKAKYTSVPMSFADACLVRMTELLPDPVILTTDSDFKIYRRHQRHTIPLLSPF
jgi:predicted nucleic acid-binding protein